MSNSEWDQFWESGRSGRSGGCLSERPAALEAAQRHFWEEFARSLPKSARVLDLATGDGIVMRWMIGARRDLKPFGVDFAERIPAPPKGCRSRGGVAVESLPVADQSQHAVTSQFGIEYGDIRRAIPEIGRVLKPSGRAAIVTHTADGPILEHNRHRRDGLNWALFDAELPGKARGGLRLRQMGIAVPPAIAAAPAEAQRRFGQGSAAWEFAEAVVQTMARGRGDTDQALRSAIATLEGLAIGEIRRIDALEKACDAMADSDAFVRQFAAAGLALTASGSLVDESGGRTFAHSWIFAKAAQAGA